MIVANYGFKTFQQDVSITAGETTSVRADLVPDGAMVSGPWGRIQIEVGTLTRGDYAVLLNGKTPSYFVGHVDEFNQDIWWKQELIVPPGTHQVTITRHGDVVWSGSVPIVANQRVLINLGRDTQRTTDWPRGAELDTMPRFSAGLVSTSVVIAPVSGTIKADPTRVDCGQPSQLAWSSKETIDSEISGFSPVPTDERKNSVANQNYSLRPHGNRPRGRCQSKRYSRSESDGKRSTASFDLRSALSTDRRQSDHTRGCDAELVDVECQRSFTGSVRVGRSRRDSFRAVGSGSDPRTARSIRQSPTVYTQPMSAAAQRPETSLSTSQVPSSRFRRLC